MNEDLSLRANRVGSDIRSACSCRNVLLGLAIASVLEEAAVNV